MSRLIHHLSQQSLEELAGFLHDYDYVRGNQGFTNARRVLLGVEFLRSHPRAAQRRRAIRQRRARERRSHN